ncbi:MAG: hypothetical protein PF904_07725 [Kiritimatiellae bacterium]|jgi:hypothetical protein|nr:hypothetical protein [Kiritimatiellia bacterium]
MGESSLLGIGIGIAIECSNHRIKFDTDADTDCDTDSKGGSAAPLEGPWLTVHNPQELHFQW